MENSKQRDWLQAFPIDIKGLYEKVDEPLPHSLKRWWWCWGGVVGLLFIVMVITGLLLAMYYRAEPETAYNSVSYITETARYGWFVRSIHQWSATFMIIFLYLHMIRVFVTGAFREYRWGAWMVGVGLMGVTLGLGFTGYSLVYEQQSFWAITITGNLFSKVPIVGEGLKQFFFAGDSVNSATLSRMYALHVQILPAALFILAIFHIFFVRLLGMHIPGNKNDIEEEEVVTTREGAYHFFPDHFYGELAFVLYLILVICLLAIVYPAKMGPPSDPLVTPEHIKPEWYFYPFYHLLKLVSESVGVAIMIVAGGALFFWPLLDHYFFRKFDRLLKGRFELSLIGGLIGIFFYLAWALAEVG